MSNDTTREALRARAIEIARKHAKAKPQSYYAEPFQPHEWVIDALVEALTPSPRPPTMSNDTTREALHAMNDALCDFGRRWTMDGDYLRCMSCKRPIIASHGKPMVHDDGCKLAATTEAHPWAALLEILRPKIAALTPSPAQAEGEAVGDADWMSGPRDVCFYLRWALGVIEEHGFDEFSLRVRHMHEEATSVLAARAKESRHDG